MITDARLRENVRPIEGLEWITALRAPAIQALVAGGTLQLSLFDQQDLAEITHPDYPGERLIVCKNPLLAEERARKRGELLAATERDLATIAATTQRTRQPLRGQAQIALRVGKVLGRRNVGKHFVLEITDTSFRAVRDEAAIAREAALDGVYVLRTSVAADRLPTAEAVRSYKRLAAIERPYRSLKTVDLKVRPIHHRKADRVRAHVFLCLLAYYVEWHMRRALAPILFDDDDPAAGGGCAPLGGGAGPAVAPGQGQGIDQAHRRGSSRTQLPHPLGRPGHAHEESRATQGARRPRLRDAHDAHAAPASGLRSARGVTRTVVSTRAPCAWKVRPIANFRL